MTPRAAKWIRTRITIDDHDTSCADPPESAIRRLTDADEVTLRTVREKGVRVVVLEIRKGSYWDRQQQDIGFGDWCCKWWRWARETGETTFPDRQSPELIINECFL